MFEIPSSNEAKKNFASKILRRYGYKEEASFVDQLPDNDVMMECMIDWNMIASIIRMQDPQKY